MIRPARPSFAEVLESFLTLIVGVMAIPAIALLVIASSTMQVAPDHMRR